MVYTSTAPSPPADTAPPEENTPMDDVWDNYNFERLTKMNLTYSVRRSKGTRTNIC